MHSYCEHHRQLSIRNQRVFDQKKRRQLELSEEPETQPKRPRRRSTTISSREEVNEAQTSNSVEDLDTKHFSRSSDSTRVTTI
ncbi:hypothetical protein PHMEG_00023206 [Phytophthora megakarya]|uniref:Uncharacterized protein n=1 Tax=Phytophthora megakarya TaxID=4795 RepID=A0A225VIY7_9STRA|nr:hypothetical protein PHMEG_00023206 [Phytophthora megakarya]